MTLRLGRFVLMAYWQAPRLSGLRGGTLSLGVRWYPVNVGIGFAHRLKVEWR